MTEYAHVFLECYFHLLGLLEMDDPGVPMPGAPLRITLPHKLGNGCLARNDMPPPGGIECPCIAPLVGDKIQTGHYCMCVGLCNLTFSWCTCRSKVSSLD